MSVSAATLTTIDPLLGSGFSRSAVRQRPSQATFRRRRRTVGAVVVFTLATGLITTNAFASNPAPANQVVPRTVVVESGDTIWSIARTIAPKGGIADLVAELIRLNGTHLEPGQVVRIP